MKNGIQKMDFTDDIWYYILEFMDYPSTVAMATTCRHFENMFSHMVIGAFDSNKDWSKYTKWRGNISLRIASKVYHDNHRQFIKTCRPCDFDTMMHNLNRSKAAKREVILACCFNVELYEYIKHKPTFGALCYSEHIELFKIIFDTNSAEALRVYVDACNYSFPNLIHRIKLCLTCEEFTRVLDDVGYFTEISNHRNTSNLYINMTKCSAGMNYLLSKYRQPCLIRKMYRDRTIISRLVPIVK